MEAVQKGVRSGEGGRDREWEGKRKEGKVREKKRKNTNEERHVILVVLLFTFS